ncbi:penicillin-insensitive murein endopeptidase [Myxococcota bacterium]|nr:penicillin-insensitive murein endopeptidase [Myxococcota bacterium]
MLTTPIAALCLALSPSLATTAAFTLGAPSPATLASVELGSVTLASVERVSPHLAETSSVTDDEAANHVAIEESEAHEDGESDEGTLEEDDAIVETSTAVEPLRPKIELTDDELKHLWQTDRAALGSMSIGFPDAGRLINAVAFPRDPRWTIVEPAKTFATQETVDYLKAALEQVHERFPSTEPLRVNHMSSKEGGWLRPHQSHQSGRDVDLAFYYKPGVNQRARAREQVIDPARNWALVRALVTETDVQLILVDRRIQKVIYDHALSIGEDRAWLDSLFNDGRRSIVQHARRHRDHFHVRFFNPRAQELGRRIQPLLGEDEKVQQLVRHRIRKGDTLGKIARRYGVTVNAIRRTNHMKNSFLRVGRAIVIPVRAKSCGRCATVPEVVIPPRRLPPAPLSTG